MLTQFVMGLGRAAAGLRSGQKWECLCEQSWVAEALYEQSWISDALYEQSWILDVLYEQSWILDVLYEQSWIADVLYEQSWIADVLYEQSWIADLLYEQSWIADLLYEQSWIADVCMNRVGSRTLCTNRVHPPTQILAKKKPGITRLFESERLRVPLAYFFASSARCFSYFLTRSSWILRGTGAYFANSIVNSPLPWVPERNSVENPNISESGTSASTVTNAS